MKKFLFMSGLVILLYICGCTQNNGYIGPIFGSWSLMEITEDGIHLDIEKETVFSFQNEVVRVTQVSDNPFEAITRYGNFTIEEDVLSLKFLLAPTPDGDGYRFLVPSWLYFPKGEMPLKFELRTLNGSSMVLCIDNGGKKLVYTFIKTW